MPTIAPGFTQGSCTNVTKVTLTQPEISELRQLVFSAMTGGPEKFDGLLEQVGVLDPDKKIDHYSPTDQAQWSPKLKEFKARGQTGLGVEAILVKEWAYKHLSTYKRFAKFNLIPRVSGCKTDSPQGPALCSTIAVAKRDMSVDVSPDFYSNLVYLFKS